MNAQEKQSLRDKVEIVNQLDTVNDKLSFLALFSRVLTEYFNEEEAGGFFVTIMDIKEIIESVRNNPELHPNKQLTPDELIELELHEIDPVLEQA